jgi:hypothetical protein
MKRPPSKSWCCRALPSNARVKARAAAKAQALALRSTQPAHVDADAPLPERLLSFVRLHPLATAAAGLAHGSGTAQADSLG